MTATRTVLFTDLAGYTEKVSGTDREGLRRIPREHEEMVRPIVERHGGTVELTSAMGEGTTVTLRIPAA